jgi:hypothetical protein
MMDPDREQLCGPKNVPDPDRICSPYPVWFAGA